MSKGTVIKGFLIIIALAAMVAVRVGYLQRSHYIDAEAHYAAGEQKLAVREYGSALHLHFPFSPYSKRSALRLWSMGLDFEEEGKPQWAQMAFTSLRSSFYASRSFYTPGRRWIEKCDEKLASLRAAMLVEAGSIGGAQGGPRSGAHMGRAGGGLFFRLPGIGSLPDISWI
jgi:hypothetical protein